MPPGTRFDNIMPEMPVRNLSAAVGFYTKVLGFKQEHLHGDEYAVMRREGVRIGLKRAEPPDVPAGGGRLYAFVSGIDEFFDAVQASLAPAGGRLVDELAPRPYGLKDFAISDPDGNRLGFGEYL
jgi:catechol 2,3-dioxygenase-like lactoylglutathione lyase family enzyme